MPTHALHRYSQSARLTIDVSFERVSLEGKDVCRTLHGQWVPFYLALALRSVGEEEPFFVDARELQVLGSWFHKKPSNIGKEVARHLQGLHASGLTNFVLHDGRTKRWRLAVPAEAICFRPSLEACELWLRERRWDFLDSIERIPVAIVQWITRITRALIRLEEGRIKEGLQLVADAKREHLDSVLLGAIAELVELRLYARLGEYPEIGEYLLQCEGSIGKTLLIRAKVAQALEPDFDNLQAAIENYRKLALRLENLPDINGLGSTYNALGVLFRRKGQLGDAARCLRYAVALLVASFDLPTLQGALFNLGHTLYQSAKTERGLREALSIIQLDREICGALGIGRDSAQAEIVAGHLCLQLRDVDAAQRWLDAGREVLETLSSDYNRAGVEELHAHILWARAWQANRRPDPDEARAILERFKEAQWYLLTAGFPARDLEEQVLMVKRGLRPLWFGPSAART